MVRHVLADTQEVFVVRRRRHRKSGHPNLSSLPSPDARFRDLSRLEEDGEISPHVPNVINKFIERRPSRDWMMEHGIMKTQVQQVSRPFKSIALIASRETSRTTASYLLIHTHVKSAVRGKLCLYFTLQSDSSRMSLMQRC